MIATVWFCLVAMILAGYVVLDGFDLGAGVVHLFVAVDDKERKQVIGSIGPVWDGNEVWLIAGGGTVYFAFPALYSAAFSGFYLALMMVLWLLILRGIAIELRSHMDQPLWRSFWDVVFGSASALLALLFGAALGNVVRGVPLNSEGFFFLPLWTDFQPGKDVGIVDWYTLLAGATSFVALTVHGCYWIAARIAGSLRQRARSLAKKAWWLLAAFTALTTYFSFRVQPHLARQFLDHPWGDLLPAIALLGLAGMLWFSLRGRDVFAFLSSCLYLTGMLTSVAFGIFPYVLPSNVSAEAGLTVFNSSAAPHGLYIGLVWWIPGMLLALVYSAIVYRRLPSRLTIPP